VCSSDLYSLKQLLTTDCCGNIKKSNNNVKESLPDEQFIKKPADLKKGFVYWNEDTKQFEFSETELETNDMVPVEVDNVGNHHWWVRHSLLGGNIYDSSSFNPAVPAEVYKVGCNSQDKANYGGFCIWSGPKIIYKTINRNTYPPYGEVSRIEKWKLGRNTGQVYPISMEWSGPDGARWKRLSGPGKDTTYFTNDSKWKSS
jgi:hypothetical protein